VSADDPDYLITIEVMRKDGETWGRVLLDGNDVTDRRTERALLSRAFPVIASLAIRGSVPDEESD
jgi:hypothetical protein